MKKLLGFMLRWTYVLAVAISVAYLAFHFVERTTWFKDRLYHLLVNGESQQQFRAATTLTRLRGEEQLLRALKSEGAHEMARRGLEHLWFTAAGSDAFERVEQAHRAAQKEDFKESLLILDCLIADHPKFAEAWNQRASVLWQLGRFKESINDCERALALNPHHYGAWQGLGVCQLGLGDLSEACRSLRAALRIAPYDGATRRSLRQCEELLRNYPPLDQRARPGDLI